MKKIIAILALAAMSSTAHAADWESGKGDRWTGFYLGAGGYGSGGDIGSLDWYAIGVYGEVGADYQIGNFVIGANASLGGGYLDLEVVDGGQAMFTGLGRAGFAFDNVLVYGTGGYAMASACISNICANGDGAIYGGGVEWMASDHWSVKGEVLYDGYSPTGRFGVNYRF